jgi:hypothetical protein
MQNRDVAERAIGGLIGFALLDNQRFGPRGGASKQLHHQHL